MARWRARRSRSPLDQVVRLPAHAVYAHWEMPGPTATLEFDLTVHDDPGTSVGEYLALFNGTIDGAAFYCGLQTDVNCPGQGGIGKGLIFSTWWSFDAADSRVAGDGFVELGTHEGRFVGVRRPFPWGAGHYRVVLARAEPDTADGRALDWFDLTIGPTNPPPAWGERPPATAPPTLIGSLRFPRRSADVAAAVERGGLSFLEVYAGVRAWADVPRWDVDLMAFGDGRPCPAGRTEYTDHPHGQPMPNADIAYDPASGRVRMAIGTDVTRDHRGARWP